MSNESDRLALIDWHANRPTPEASGYAGDPPLVVTAADAARYDSAPPF